ncbi:MAG: hypothetical protein ABI323_06480 [Solirubrobacteraceae bacterium]
MTLVVAPWDLPGQVAQAINAWLISFAQSIFGFALTAITDLLALTPHFERVIQVERLWNVTRGIADGFLVLIALIGGLLIMTSSVAGTRYTVKVIVSRLFIAALLANVSLSLFGAMVDVNNAFNMALLGGQKPGQQMLSALQGGVAGVSVLQLPVYALLSVVAGVLMLALVMVYLARSALLVLALVSAPIAIICYALPQTQAATRAWWRVTAAIFLLQPVNALLLGIAGRIFFSSQVDWGLNPVSVSIGPLLAIILLYVLVRTPWWIYHHLIAPQTYHHARSIVSTAIGAARFVATRMPA